MVLLTYTIFSGIVNRLENCMSKRPIVAIIGRPNVGKSSLFNRFAKKRTAIVSAKSGTTRDRLYTTVMLDTVAVDLIDTAGLSKDLDELNFGHEMLEQVQQAVSEADALIFVLDAHSGFTAEDHQLAEIIRKAQTPTIVYVNKVDNLEGTIDEKLLSTGIGTTLTGSLVQRRGLNELRTAVELLVKDVPSEPMDLTSPIDHPPRIALVGRPNVGKSTLFNALLGYERVIVSDIPGTTRDTIDTELKLESGERFIITDTAGLRRRGKIGRAEKVEQYSVLRTLRAIDESDLVLLVVDSSEGLTRGDVHVAMYAIEQKKQLITVFNKTDLVDPKQVNFHRFPFLKRRPMIFVSAMEGTFIDQLLLQIVDLLHNQHQTLNQNYSPEKPPTSPDR